MGPTNRNKNQRIERVKDMSEKIKDQYSYNLGYIAGTKRVLKLQRRITELERMKRPLVAPVICSKCNSHIEVPLWKSELRAMAKQSAKWFFQGLIKDEAWRSDQELVLWLAKGWIEYDPRQGFRITEQGIQASI